MSEERYGPSQACDGILQSKLWRAVRAIGASLFTVALLATLGCDQPEPVQKIPNLERPAPEPPATETPQASRPVPDQPHVIEGSGVTVWADKFRGKLIAGLDGGVYLPYRPSTIERVQMALRGRGLYTGPANGILDRPTMQSIFEFQEAANLQRCGVPTPHTRDLLQRGSHTDLTS